jgi:hypothetical protein
VGGFRTSHCVRQIADRSEIRGLGRDPTGQAARDLLQQPAIVWVAELDMRSVAAMLGVRTNDPQTSKQIGLVSPCVYAAAAVEDLAGLDSSIEQIFACALDVGHN